jgi:hypothetical protein
MANTKFSYPNEITWFIVFDDNQNVISYGQVTPQQVMETKWSEVFYFEDENSWVEMLIDNGINPFPVEDLAEDEE